MPPRKARASLPLAAPKTARNKNRKRNLDAYSIASHSLPSKPGPRHRLGELIDDRPQQKRQRPASDHENDGSTDEDIPAKRRKQTTVADDEEEGSDSEGNEWRLGGLREDDEDSELDSDEAFDESDEERFAGFAFRGSLSAGGKKRGKVVGRGEREEDEDEDGHIDLDEDDVQDGGEEDDFGDEGVDIATMLDDEDSDEDVGNVDGSEDDGEQEENSPPDSESSQDEDEEDDDPLNEERIARMRDRIDALDSTTTTKPQAAPRSTGGLTMEALLAASGNSPAVKEAAKSSKKAKPYEAPLPQRQQDRINRNVASQKANEQLDRWLPTVKRRREAEHLMFPLVDPERSEPVGKEKFVRTEKPQNEFEKAMHDILEQSGMTRGKDVNEETGEMQAEDLIENQPSLQEVMERRAELRRRRDILFDAERKAKRISKIKSKAYRRVHRRERQRVAEYEKEAMDSADEENERERAERRRAEARMSTKARDSKWAKSLKATNRTVWDGEAREGVLERARREEELRRRVAGSDVDAESESDGDESDGQSDDDEDGRMSKQLARISKDETDQKQNQGLAGLDFMRAADERQRKRNEEDVESLRKELAIEDGDEVDEEGAEGEIDDQALGRAIFGPKAREQKELVTKGVRNELEEGEGSDEEVEEDEADEIHFDEKSTKAFANGAPRKPSVTGHASNRPKPHTTNESNLNSSAMSNWFAKPSKADKVKPGRDIELSPLENPREMEEQSPAIASKANRKAAEQDVNASNTNGWTVVKHNSNNSDDADSDAPEPNEPNPILTKQQQQAEYHRLAFAGDNVKKTFDAEKAEAVQSEDEKEVSTHLPGWGSWTGAGLTKSIRKSNARARHNPLYKTKLPGGVKAEDRKDARLENVIISEKLDRKGKKYQADLLPHVFETKRQYERSLRVPMGPEWVTKETHQKATQPRVIVKPGVVINAMEKPLV